MSVVDIDNK